MWLWSTVPGLDYRSPDFKKKKIHQFDSPSLRNYETKQPKYTIMLLDDFGGVIREFLNGIIAYHCEPPAWFPMHLLSECVLGSFIKHFTLCLENYIVFPYKMTFMLLVILFGLEVISECHHNFHNFKKSFWTGIPPSGPHTCSAFGLYCLVAHYFL